MELLTVEIRINRLTGRQQLVVNNFFPTTHTRAHAHTHTEHHFSWRQSFATVCGVYLALPTIFFVHYCHT